MGYQEILHSKDGFIKANESAEIIIEQNRRLDEIRSVVDEPGLLALAIASIADEHKATIEELHDTVNDLPYEEILVLLTDIQQKIEILESQKEALIKEQEKLHRQCEFIIENVHSNIMEIKALRDMKSRIIEVKIIETEGELGALVGKYCDLVLIAKKYGSPWALPKAYQVPLATEAVPTTDEHEQVTSDDAEIEEDLQSIIERIDIDKLSDKIACHFIMRPGEVFTVDDLAEHIYLSGLDKQKVALIISSILEARVQSIVFDYIDAAEYKMQFGERYYLKENVENQDESPQEERIYRAYPKDAPPDVLAKKTDDFEDLWLTA